MGWSFVVQGAHDQTLLAIVRRAVCAQPARAPPTGKCSQSGPCRVILVVGVTRSSDPCGIAQTCKRLDLLFGLYVLHLGCTVKRKHHRKPTAAAAAELAKPWPTSACGCATGG
eukprot:scaffold67495_cov58-Phaeocystis_antarctica.AAC.3